MEDLVDIEPRHWYLSFADESGWLGGVFLDAIGEVWAVSEAWRLGANPGGEVVMVEIPALPPADWCNRLLNRDEIEEVPEP